MNDPENLFFYIDKILFLSDFQIFYNKWYSSLSFIDIQIQTSMKMIIETIVVSLLPSLTILDLDISHHMKEWPGQVLGTIQKT